MEQNCKFCTRHKDRDLLADPSDNILVCGARVARTALPLTAGDEFGMLEWSRAQREDSILGPVCDWVRDGKREEV